MTEYKRQLEEINKRYSEKSIKESDMEYFKENFNKEKVIKLLENIIEDEYLLRKVADRSYSHALGFDKIVLIDLSKDIKDCDTKTQLRLHFWDANNDAVPMVESMHEHSFNFISTVLSGYLENQVFEYNELSKKEEELYLLTSIQGYYVSNRVRGEKKAYKHVFDKNIILNACKVKHINEGEYYYHDYKNPHRLYFDNKILNSTILITTPEPKNPQGGSLQRPTYYQKDEINYTKKSINVLELKNKFEGYINYLKKV